MFTVLTPLNKGERDVLDMMIEGKRPKQIAPILCISLRRLEARLKSARAKSDAKTIAQLVAIYLEDTA